VVTLLLAAALAAHPAPARAGTVDASVPPADAVPIAAPRQPGTSLLYFFSPDWRPPDLGKLTAAVEKAFASGGVPISFQAFTRYEDFERQVAEAPPEFLIAPAWLADSPPGLSLTVIAHPLHHGKSTYRKALMTRPGIDSIDDLARGSIAATVHSMSNGSPDAVLGAFHLAVDSARVVPVPKDIDALLALSFGQVDAALVTSQQYEELAKTSPAEAERLRVLAFSPEVGLPPVFASAKADPWLTERLRDLLLRLPEVPEGADVLAMLGFDGFVAEVPAAPVAEASAPAAAAKNEQTGQPAAEPGHRAAKPGTVGRARQARAHRK
jgi:ABC-type amino acid transport substrate-binding protein